MDKTEIKVQKVLHLYMKILHVVKVAFQTTGERTEYVTRAVETRHCASE